MKGVTVLSGDILKDEQQKAEQLLAMNMLTPENSVFRETAGGFVAVTVNDEDKGHVNVIRTFPLSDADEYLSVRLPDGKQEEIGLIEKLTDFDETTVEVISKQLKLRYFMPRILKIIEVKEQYGYTYWTVETDKGKAKFASSSGSAGAVIRHGEGAIVKDSNENRYLIEDISRLTPKELKKLDLYL